MHIAATTKIAEQALEELAQAIERGESAAFRAYLATMARFHRYSPRNILLIRAQCPNATHVAGFHAWRHKFGRTVQRGARGIAILSPIVIRPPTTEDADDDESTPIGFRTAYVFDESQTSGPPLPEALSAQGNPGAYLERLQQMVAKRGIQLSYSTEIAPARGVSSLGAITLLPNMQPGEHFSVLVHELAHELLHDRTARSDRAAANQQELEAEAVAFVVCHGVGLEAVTASADYLLHYAADRAALARSLDRIQRLASELLTALTET